MVDLGINLGLAITDPGLNLGLTLVNQGLALASLFLVFLAANFDDVTDVISDLNVLNALEPPVLLDLVLDLVCVVILVLHKKLAFSFHSASKFLNSSFPLVVFFVISICRFNEE